MYGVYNSFMEQRLTISKLAKASGVGIETIRFYHRQKILDLPVKKLNSVRYYDQQTIEKIEFIKRAQSVGFSLAEIKDIFKLKLTPKSECTPIKVKTQKKIEEVQNKIVQLQKILKALKNFESKCDGHETTEKCSILDGLKELKRG
jgi:MerR family transcriptional regulator, copper efflux regulator